MDAKITKSSLRKAIGKKAINAAANAAAKSVTTAAKTLRDYRKTLNATVAYLATADIPEAEEFRAFFGMPKNANNTTRRAVAQQISKMAPYVLEQRYVNVDDDDNTTITINRVPATKSGREVTDYLSVVVAIVRETAKRTTTRRAMIQAAWILRRKMIDKGTYRNHITLFWTAIGAIPQKSIKPAVSVKWIFS